MGYRTPPPNDKGARQKRGWRKHLKHGEERMTIPEEFKPKTEETPVSGASVTPAETEVTEEQVTPVVETPTEDVHEKSRYQARIDQLTAARRQAEERALQAETQLARQYQQYQAPVAPGGRPGQEVPMVGQMSKDDWLIWHEEDPYAATEYVSDLRADQKAKQIMSQMQTAGAYSSTVNEVYSNHPELKDVMDGTKSPDEVPFWQVYDQVAREMPEAQQLAKGPLIVMREAERRMRDQEQAISQKQVAEQAAIQESERQARVGAGYTAGSSSRPPSAGTVKLSPDEERIARKMGISPEEYAANKKVK